MQNMQELFARIASLYGKVSIKCIQRLVNKGLINEQNDNYTLLLLQHNYGSKKLWCTNNFVDKEIFALFPGCIFLFDYWCH